MTLKYWADIDETTKQLSLLGSDTDDSRHHLPFGKIFKFAVATFTVKEGCPLDAQQFAQNIASLLNNRTAPHHISADAQQIHYSRTSAGFFLKAKPEGGPGVSQDVIEITFADKGHQAVIGDSIRHRMDNDFMKKVCDGIICDGLNVTPQHRGPTGPTAQP